MGDFMMLLRDLVVWLYAHWPFVLLTLGIGVVQWLRETRETSRSRYQGRVLSRAAAPRAPKSEIKQTDRTPDAVADEPVDEDALGALRSLGFTKAAALQALRTTVSDRDFTTADRVLRVLRTAPSAQGPDSRQ